MVNVDWTIPSWDRFYHGPFAQGDNEDQRTPPERDRDRILYAPAFRRLANITQVVSPTQGVVVHNRLTHSLKVAQLTQRLAEALHQRQETEAKAHDLDIAAAEAAALAHDLGHPPFGHVAEKKLCELLDGQKDIRAGYEGNAQSFRIVTVLEEQPYIDNGGLDLTRKTLDALLKYPWLRESEGSHGEKWGAYGTEHNQLKWARELHPPGELRKCPEAEVMDWADDVAYSVHDLEDFYRGGLIPLDQLSAPEGIERKTFEDRAIVNIGRKHPAWIARGDDLR